MGNPLAVIAAILGAAVLYVLLPVGLDTFQRFRKRRVVGCPETGREAEVGVDVIRAALGSTLGRRRILSVRECSLWPERKDCPQSCLLVLAEGSLGGSPPSQRG